MSYEEGNGKKKKINECAGLVYSFLIDMSWQIEVGCRVLGMESFT
jgi:hypothetical protein